MEMRTAYPATLQDIVFEGRNKAYGAYLLRKLYPKHLGQGLFLAIVSLVLLLSMPLVIGKLFGSDIVVIPPGIEQPVVTLTTVVLPPQPAKVEPAPEVPKGGQKNVATIKDVTPKVVDDNTTVTDVIPPRDVVVNTTAGLVTTPGDGAANTDNPEVGTGTGDDMGAGKGTAATAVEPFISVEQMPEFAGGMSKMMEFVGKNIRYPDAAKRQGVEGTVVISFVVGIDGDVGDVTVLKGLGYGTEEEASRVIKRMPRWKPGVQNGIKVPVRMTIPIRLELK